MKIKSERYQQAVERNIRHVKKNAAKVVNATKAEDKQLSALKMKLGIQENDSTHDGDLNAALNTARAAKAE